jgi:molybdate transport system substrate-binding protein
VRYLSGVIRALLEGLLLGVLLAAPAGAESELVVGAAVSLREPATGIARAFEAKHPDTRVRLAFGATNLLAEQVRAGAPMDVLLSADERIVRALVKEGLVPADAHFPIASNRLVVVQRPDAPFRLTGPDDLTRPELRRIAIPEYAVPVGHYARDWLEERGLLEALRSRIVPTEHARATLAAVDQGHADAAIVYASDARLARSAVVAFAVPAAEQPRIVYVAARLSDAPGPARADAFLAFLRGPRAAALLAAAGFGAAPEPGR